MEKQAILYGPYAKRPTAFNSISEMIVYTAEHHGERGLTFLLPDGSEVFTSYKQHLLNAKSVLKALQDKGIRKGEHILLVINDPEKFYIAFWACMLGGLVAIPLAEPTSYVAGSNGFKRVENIWKENQHGHVIITRQQENSVLELKKEKDFENFSYLCLEDLIQSQLDCEIPKIEDDDIIFIQYSSGSTGRPKGILLTNRNIMENVNSLVHSYRSDENDRTFNWLPQNHNMGIFGLHLTSVMVGSAQYIMASHHFIRDPYLFLKKLSDHRGNWFAASNFAFEWMEQKITPEQVATLDLSCIVRAYNGADPISLNVVDSFLNKFVKAGFPKHTMKPAYGLSECTLAATLTSLDVPYYWEYVDRDILATEKRAVAVNAVEEGEANRMVCVGTPIHNVTVRVCDENNQVLKQREIGEIQIAGGLVSQGYYTQDTIIPLVNEDNFLPTGDLGYIVDEGVVITGRIKDVIVIRGKNYISSDFEDAIFEDLKLQRSNIAVTSSFSGEKGHEELLVFIEYDKDVISFLPLASSAKKLIMKKFGLEADFVLPVEQFPRTSTGKIQRFALKCQYQNKQYQTIIKQIQQSMNSNQKSDMESKSISGDAIQGIWCQVLNIPESQVEMDASFLEIGGTSVKAYEFLGKLSELIGVDIPSSIFSKCETLSEFIDYFSNNSSIVKTDMATTTIEKVHTKETVAITGMALRFPDAENIEQFWRNLVEGKDSIKRVSLSRRELLDLPEWNDWLGEINDVNSFDYEFFNIDLEEAKVMDPQQRILLELAYQALEDAGAINDVESEKNFATYAATSFNAYLPIIFDAIKKDAMIHPKALVRNLNNVIAAEIAHKFNMTGHSIAIDSACSSFLVAIHQARKSIIKGEVEGAVVTGSFLILNEMIHRLADKGGILSSNNQSKTFDINADGSTLGEGCIVLVLEKTSAAQAKNKHIYGEIIGSAINNDGYSLSIMAPNPRGQYNVLKDAYHDAGISPYDIGMYEAHGTGTEIGDPVEINALAKLFANYPKKDRTVSIGSVKTNIGHLLPAAGGAGIAKMLLSMMHNKIPPSLNIEKLNPKLLMEQTPLSVVTEVQPWLQEKKYGAVNSLGLGGTNAHIILSKNSDVIKLSDDHSHYVVTVSAKNSRDLLPQVENLKAYIDSNKHNIHNIAYTRNCKRPHYDHRAVAIYDKAGNCVKPFESAQKIKFGNIDVVAIIENAQDISSLDKLDQLMSITACLGERIKVFTIDKSRVLERFGIEYMRSEEVASLKTDILIHFNENQTALIKHKKIVIYPTVENGFNYETVLAMLYLSGVDLTWDTLYPSEHYSTLLLPSYQFKKNKVWLDQVK